MSKKKKAQPWDEYIEVFLVSTTPAFVWSFSSVIEWLVRYLP